MASRLRGLRLKELSLVKRGANPGARVLFTKSAEEHVMPGLKDFTDRLQAVLTTIATGKKPDGTVVKEDAEVEAVIKEQVAAIAKDLSEPVEKKPDGEADPDDEMTKEADAVQEAIEKGIAAATEQFRKEAEEVRKRADKAEQEVQKMRDEQANAFALAKATAMLGDLSGKPEELAPIVKKLTDAEVATLDKVLAGGRAALSDASLLKEIGHSTPRPGSPEESIEAAASALLKVDPKLSKAQAVTKALEANPALYTQTITRK
jgi:hypothetical protein